MPPRRRRRTFLHRFTDQDRIVADEGRVALGIGRIPDGGIERPARVGNADQAEADGVGRTCRCREQTGKQHQAHQQPHFTAPTRDRTALAALTCSATSHLGVTSAGRRLAGGLGTARTALNRQLRKRHVPDRLIDLRSDTLTRPTDRHAPGHGQRPRSATISMARTSRSMRWRPASPICWASRPRCSCRAAPWPNQIAVKVLTRPGEEVITGGEAHLLWHEAGGASANAGVQIIALGTERHLHRGRTARRLQAARPHGVPADHAGGDREHP